MSDFHHRLADWLGAGAPGEPARDVALHASACETCLGRVAALEALADIDLGTAPIPPPAAGQAVSSAILVRAVIGTTAVAVLSVGIAAGSGLLPPSVPADGGRASSASPTPGGGVLAGEGAPSTQSPSTHSPSTTDSANASASPSKAAPSAETTPGPVAGGPPASTPAPQPTPSSGPPVTPRPPTPSPRSLTPPPLPTPTVQPTPTPIVPPLNAPPVALADAYSVAPGQTLAVDAAAGLLTNDTDPDGDVLTAFADSVAGLTLNADGSFTFEAPADFTGTTFSYFASDGVASSSPATVSIAAAP